MVTVSSIAINTAIYAMIHMAFFYIPINFGFNLPHYVTSYMHHKGKNKSKKEKEKKGGQEKFATRGLERAPSEYVSTKN